MSVVFKAEKREKLGSSAAKKIKRDGRIPAIIYSKNGNINFSLESKAFEQEYFKDSSLTSLVEIELGGKKLKAIAHKVELDPVSDRPVHIDFFSCEESDKVRAKPKLVFTNQDKSPGLKKGGFLHIVLRRVEVLCDGKSPESIPDSIKIDTGSLHVGSKIRASNLILPQGVSLAKKGNFLIASIIGRGKSEEDKSATTAEGSSAAAPAGGSAAAAPAAKSEGADKKPAAKDKK